MPAIVRIRNIKHVESAISAGMDNRGTPEAGAHGEKKAIGTSEANAKGGERSTLPLGIQGNEIDPIESLAIEFVGSIRRKGLDGKTDLLDAHKGRSMHRFRNQNLHRMFLSQYLCIANALYIFSFQNFHENYGEDSLNMILAWNMHSLLTLWK